MPYKEGNELIDLYYSGLKKSKQEWTDEFSKQLRFYSLIQLAISVLKKNEVFDFVECGCWRGHFSFIISSLIFKNKKKLIFIFLIALRAYLSLLKKMEVITIKVKNIKII